MFKYRWSYTILKRMTSAKTKGVVGRERLLEKTDKEDREVKQRSTDRLLKRRLVVETKTYDKDAVNCER